MSRYLRVAHVRPEALRQAAVDEDVRAALVRRGPVRPRRTQPLGILPAPRMRGGQLRAVQGDSRVVLQPARVPERALRQQGRPRRGSLPPPLRGGAAAGQKGKSRQEGRGKGGKEGGQARWRLSMAPPRRSTHRDCARQRPVLTGGILARAAGRANSGPPPRAWTLATGAAVAGGVSRAVASVPRRAPWWWWWWWWWTPACGLPRLCG